MNSKEIESKRKEVYERPQCEVYNMELEGIIAASQLQDVNEEEAMLPAPTNQGTNSMYNA